jgi:Mce-associated membrane protein
VTRALNVVLGLIVVVLVGWLGAFAVHGSVAAPGLTPAEERAHELGDLRQAARTEALAFLTVDYRRMDQGRDRVLAGATGTFKKQFKSAKVLDPGVIRAEVVSKGYVKEIGVGTFDRDSATVFISAGSHVRSKETNGKVRELVSRLRFDMTKVGDRWLVSNLEPVA